MVSGLVIGFAVAFVVVAGGRFVRGFLWKVLWEVAVDPREGFKSSFHL